MKKQFLKHSLLALVSVTLLSTTACKKDKDETPQPKTGTETPNNGNPGGGDKTPVEVTVKDTRLAAQIKTALGLGENDKITEENILKLEKLSLDAEKDLAGTLSEIADLSGLEKAANLNYLHLGYTKVTDLTPIKDLKKVTYLRINNTSISDLSPIANYTTLTYFNANTAKSITDISPLSKNTGLQEIILRDVPFGDAGMTTFANFTKLYRLNIRKTGVTDISVLADLMSKGGLLKTTEGAAAAGKDASIDLRDLTVANCDVLVPYKDTRVAIEGACSK